MTQFNPLAPAILVSQTQVHRQDADKVSQVKRHQALARNIAATSDRYEHTVESTQAVSPVHEENQKKDPPPRPKHKKLADDKKPHLDITA